VSGLRIDVSMEIAGLVVLLMLLLVVAFRKEFLGEGRAMVYLFRMKMADVRLTGVNVPEIGAGRKGGKQYVMSLIKPGDRMMLVSKQFGKCGRPIVRSSLETGVISANCFVSRTRC
jgi:hypothetical protein